MTLTETLGMIYSFRMLQLVNLNEVDYKAGECIPSSDSSFNVRLLSTLTLGHNPSETGISNSILFNS